MLKLVASKRIARDKLIREYMPVVVTIAKSMARRLPPCFDQNDLEGVGYIALIEAIDTHDPERGALGQRVRYLVRNAMGDSVRRRKWEEATRTSLDEPLDGRYEHGAQVTLADIYSDGKFRRTGICSSNLEHGAQVIEITRIRMRATLRKAIAEMPPRTALVLTMRYFGDHAVHEVATAMGIRPSRVSQLHHEGLRLLAAALTEGGVPMTYERLAAGVVAKTAA